MDCVAKVILRACWSCFAYSSKWMAANGFPWEENQALQSPSTVRPQNNGKNHLDRSATLDNFFLSDVPPQPYIMSWLILQVPSGVHVPLVGNHWFRWYLRRKKAGIILYIEFNLNCCHKTAHVLENFELLNNVSSSHLHSKSFFLTCTNTCLPCAIFSSGREEAITTCPGVITGADGNRLLHAVSSVLSLIGQKLHVSHWPVQTTGASWS